MARRIGPFYKDQVDPEKSLTWFAYNSNKRSITLDLEEEEGRALFRRMAQKADFVLGDRFDRPVATNHHCCPSARAVV